ncbi:MAG: hypothetical protein ABR589_00015 [Chthoniobacterales bacterium]
MKRFSYQLVAAFSAAVIFSVSSATASPVSQNEDNRYRSFDEIFSATAAPGALTMEAFPSFDFRTAGVGSWVFVRSSRRSPLLAAPQWEAREEYGTSYNDSSYASLGSFDLPKFSNTSAATSILSPLDDSGLGLNGDITTAPEPTTWATGALALLAIGYTQRRRLRWCAVVEA